jgi:plasmid stabilization system protein ParE
MAQVVWTPLALRRLDEIVVYIARDSPSAALSMEQALIAAVARVGMWPLSGVWVGARYPSLTGLDQNYRLIVERPYIVFYRASGDEVRVITIQHGAQLPPRAQVLQPSE